MMMVGSIHIFSLFVFNCMCCLATRRNKAYYITSRSILAMALQFI